MAKSVHPNDWLANIVNTGTPVDGITFMLADIPEVSIAEATVATGDIRKVMLGICEAVYQKWATTAVSERPLRMTCYCVPGKLPNGNEIRQYIFAFETAGPGLDVVAE